MRGRGRTFKRQKSSSVQCRSCGRFGHDSDTCAFPQSLNPSVTVRGIGRSRGLQRRPLQEISNTNRKSSTNATSAPNQEEEKAVSDVTHRIETLNPKSSSSQGKEIEKKGSNLYPRFFKFLASDKDFDLFGYPQPHAKPGCAFISLNAVYKDFKFSSTCERICEKCEKQYTVKEDGYPEGTGKCYYHAKKGYTRNKHNRRQKPVHKCCKRKFGSSGCITSKYHASHNADPSCLTGYISLQDPPDDGEKENNIYALDCEMVFTTKGRELARLTIIDVKLRTVFDKIIKPEGVVLDCATPWSGITESQLKTATFTFEDVQQYLKKTFNSQTILVGHSLENDLWALKILHNKIVDTSIVFPHQQTPKFKNSLQKLAEQFLQKRIQTEEIKGHSSEEDARTCMELMLMKIKENHKLSAPSSVLPRPPAENEGENGGMKVVAQQS